MMNEEALKKLVEQMPRLTDEEIEVALQKDYNGEVCVDDGDRAIAQAQREADAEWIVERLKRLTPEEVGRFCQR